MEIILMLLDLLIVYFAVLYLFRTVKAIIGRKRLIKQIKKICRERKHRLTLHRSPIASIFRLSKKTDLSVETHERVYHVKLFSCLARKKIYHFVDRNSYVTYLKVYFALPFAAKASESLLFSTFHRFMAEVPSDGEKESFVLLFNPVPNDVTYIDETGMRRVAGNGSFIDSMLVCNAKGFCELIEEEK